jgi:hypothetical protein
LRLAVVCDGWSLAQRTAKRNLPVRPAWQIDGYLLDAELDYNLN